MLTTFLSSFKLFLLESLSPTTTSLAFSVSDRVGIYPPCRQSTTATFGCVWSASCCPLTRRARPWQLAGTCWWSGWSRRGAQGSTRYHIADRGPKSSLDGAGPIQAPSCTCLSSATCRGSVEGPRSRIGLGSPLIGQWPEANLVEMPR